MLFNCLSIKGAVKLMKIQMKVSMFALLDIFQSSAAGWINVFVGPILNSGLAFHILI